MSFDLKNKKTISTFVRIQLKSLLLKCRGGHMSHKIQIAIILMVSLFSLPLFARMVEQEESFKIHQNSLSIEVEIDGGELIVLQSNDKNKCNVLMSYPREKCTVDVRYNEKRGQLEITIDNDEWNFNSDDEKVPQVILELPHGPEISLSAYLKAGETKFELGDLKIVDFELRNWAGESSVNFAEPNRTIMSTFDVNVKVGEVDLLNLGNALFEDADINSGIGELRVDFNGEGLEQTKAHIDLDIGETTVILPSDIATKIKVSKFLFLSDVRYPDWFEKRGSYYFSENYEDSEKKLSLNISSGIGELSIKVE
jgi:hypothetical protein